MSTCNFTTTINGTDNIGSSRTTINTNFSNLDTAACNLSTAVLNLSAQITSGALQGAQGDPGSSFFAPVGAIALFGGGSNLAASGWLLCDGTQYQSSNYPNLYSAIGSTYNLSNDPVDPAYFRVPNLIGRLAVGASTNVPLGTQSTVLFPAGGSFTLQYLNVEHYIKSV
jgi:hypothetical protein